MDKSNSLPSAGHYNANYGNFQTELYAQIRREAFGEDIGQNSWLTAGEQDIFLECLDLSSGKNLLDVACGAGGPAWRVAATTNCSVVGIDVHEQAMLSEAAAAASFGLINSIVQLGGFTGNYAIGLLNDRTHSLKASFAFTALVYFAAAGLILSLRVRDPAGGPRLNQPEDLETA
jgi:hypothetical protein